MTLLISRLEHLKEFIEEYDLNTVLKKVARAETFLKRYGNLNELLDHLEEMEHRIYIVKDFLTIEDAAKYLEVTKSTIYKMTASKEINYYKPNGKCIFILRKDLEDWIKAHPYLSNTETERKANLLAYQLEKERMLHVNKNNKR